MIDTRWLSLSLMSIEFIGKLCQLLVGEQTGYIHRADCLYIDTHLSSLGRAVVEMIVVYNT